MRTATILTFWKEENYGAILQATALQDTLNELRITTEIANFEPTHLKRPFLRQLLSFLWKQARMLLGFRKRLLKTENFRRQWINSSSPLNGKDDLLNYLCSQTYCVVGSDQVWNPQIINPQESPFLLNQIELPGKKIAYAASFGINALQENTKCIYSQSLKNFNAISVREKTGVKILSELGISSAKHVLDPTLLLSREQWLRKAAPEKKREPYVLCYIMPGKKESRAIYSLAKKISVQLGNCHIVYLGDREYNRLFRFRADTCAGPAEFLRYFADAEYVITNSFHGTCFAVNFQKKFVSLIEQASDVENRNSRIVDFLSMLGLESHIIEFSKQYGISTQNFPMSADYVAANEILKDKRETSLDFLISATRL